MKKKQLILYRILRCPKTENFEDKMVSCRLSKRAWHHDNATLRAPTYAQSSHVHVEQTALGPYELCETCDGHA